MTVLVARNFTQHLIRVTTIAPGLFTTPLMTDPSGEGHIARRPGAALQASRRTRRVRRPCRPPRHRPDAQHEVIRLVGAIRMAPR